MKRRAPSPSEFLPLPVAEFHILVALADGARHGYGIMQAVEAESAGAVRLGPGTLYSALKRMTSRGMIEETRSLLYVYIQICRQGHRRRGERASIETAPLEPDPVHTGGGSAACAARRGRGQHP